jgi:hypothetical protein
MLDFGWLARIPEILHIIWIKLELQHWLQFSEILRNFGLLFGGAFGLYLAWKRVTAANMQSIAALDQSDISGKQAELSRSVHVSELFNKAVGQLGDEKLEIRLGAVYTLRDIAKDFPDLTASVFDLLNLYVREKVTIIDANDLLGIKNEKRIVSQEIMKVLVINSGVKI